MARKSTSKPVSAKVSETKQTKERCYQPEAQNRFADLAYNANGQSLWEVHSLNPWVPDREAPPIFGRDLTFYQAVEFMRAMGAANGPCPLVMWPNWAFYPEWSMENETMFQELQIVSQQRQIERLQSELKAVRAAKPAKSLKKLSSVRTEVPR